MSNDPADGLAARLARSYLGLRTAIGALGMALPFVLLIGNSVVVGEVAIRSSVSSYYYTNMRDVFVGAMFSIGVFLVTYRYEPADTWASTIAGIAGICVALFPTSPPRANRASAVGVVHLVAASVFFLTLAFFCLFLFTRSDKSPIEQTSHKQLRNRVYRGCGVIILLCLAVVAASKLLPTTAPAVAGLVYWGEFLAIVAFGLAWATKGEAIEALNDNNPIETSA